MITPTEYIQLKAYARQDGLILGLVWVIALACLVMSIRNAQWQIGFITGTLSTPFLVFWMLRHYRDKVLEGAISYKRAFAFIAFTMVYASIILAAATFGYFYFIDAGQLVGAMMNNIKSPEVQQAFTEAGMSPNDIKEQLELMSQSRPIDFAFSVFIEGIIIALIHASLLAFLAKKVKKNGYISSNTSL